MLRCDLKHTYFTVRFIDFWKYYFTMASNNEVRLLALSEEGKENVDAVHKARDIFLTISYK